MLPVLILRQRLQFFVPGSINIATKNSCPTLYYTIGWMQLDFIDSKWNNVKHQDDAEKYPKVNTESTCCINRYRV